MLARRVERHLREVRERLPVLVRRVRCARRVADVPADHRARLFSRGPHRLPHGRPDTLGHVVRAELDGADALVGEPVQFSSARLGEGCVQPRQHDQPVWRVGAQLHRPVVERPVDRLLQLLVLEHPLARVPVVDARVELADVHVMEQYLRVGRRQPALLDLDGLEPLGVSRPVLPVGGERVDVVFPLPRCALVRLDDLRGLVPELRFDA